MKRSLLALTTFLLAAAVVVLVSSRAATAQSSRTDRKDVDTLIERIRAARARDERLTGSAEDGTTEKPKVLSEKAETKAPEKKPAETDAEAEAHKDKVLSDIERSAKSPRDYAKGLVTPEARGGAETLKAYGSGRTVDDLMERIRASRSEEEERKKAKAGEEGVLRETSPTDMRAPAADASDYRRFLTPMRGATGTVGGEAVMEVKPVPTGVTDIRQANRGDDIPDPTQQADLYEKRMRDELGVRGELPRWADSSLLGVYEANRFNRWLTTERDIRLDPGQTDLSKVYRAYEQIRNTPDTGSIIGRRDVYAPNSTSFINPTYRGSVYDVPYSSDPFQRNYSPNSTSAKYSSSGYYNLTNRDAFEDYFTREYGVSRSYVPDFSSSRGYDVNTIKQWSANLRSSYGINVRPGDMTYGDMYRLQTGLRNH